MPFDPNLSYRLHANVALRPEPFGALAYHYGNRKLVFLKSLRMVALVRSLADHDSVEAALAPLALSPRARDNYLGALTSLERSDMIVVQPRPAAHSTPSAPPQQEHLNAAIG